MGFEINKIIVAVLVTFLVVFGIGKISDLIFQTETNVVAYKVEVSTENSSATTVSSESSIDISAFLALGDVEHGKKVFKKCAACHSISKDGGNKIGSALWNVVFRPVGSVADYKYSKALSSYNKDWSWEELNGFLIKPSKWIPNNKMGFAGLKSEKDRASVILYLNQNSDNPRPLP
tara:strand:- start:58 stop:585 length:528 start_codon:yes stop_codon:yes gene_type:complete